MRYCTATPLPSRILSLKWPQLVRWSYWSPSGSRYGMKGSESPSYSNLVRSRLEMLEKCSAESQDWKNRLKEVLQIKIDDDNNNNILWINDEDVREFFKRENTLYKDEPLSAGAGQGLY